MSKSSFNARVLDACAPHCHCIAIWNPRPDGRYSIKFRWFEPPYYEGTPGVELVYLVKTNEWFLHVYNQMVHATAVPHIAAIKLIIEIYGVNPHAPTYRQRVYSRRVSRILSSHHVFQRPSEVHMVPDRNRRE